ncbi:MAG: tetratricopeptide repeat protein [Bacteroidales bacterium]|nr:tetratricopeptide repeat protein [Bacteroidales bacterium]MCF8389689.1 tetratricopeptide repeat protein [Bacteroidales bacterium]
MEILKAKKTLLILALALVVSGLKAQTFTEQVKAFQQSYILAASGNYAEGINSLKTVYMENSYEINLRLGYLSYMAGRFTEAIAYYSKAIDLMPYSIEARLGYAYPASAIGNYSKVLEQYEKILEISPNNSIVMHRIGLIYYGREDYMKAEKYFEKVVNLYPFDYEGLTMLAWTKLKLNKTREAKSLFQKALLNTPSGSTAVEGLELLGN